MKCLGKLLVLFFALSFCCVLGSAQTPSTTGATGVPQLVNFSGKATDVQGKPIAGIAGVTFAIYGEESGGSALWLETQNIQADARGNYTVQLGATKSEGLPLDLFTSSEARWLGVTINGGQEQPRVLLLSVPYALKAADAQTLGGLPASAFALAVPANVSSVSAKGSVPAATSASAAPAATSNVTTTGGTVNAIPLFSTATNIQNSILTQTGTTALNVVGKLNLPALGVATAAAGKNSRPESFVASSFNSSTGTAVPQTFALQSEAAGNDTATASGTLNLLYATGTNTPAETGLKISNKGLLTFATGQTFPGVGTITGIATASGSGLRGGGNSGNLSLSLVNNCATNQVLQWNGSAWVCFSAGNGTITKVTAGTALTGGGSSGNVTVNVDTTKVPLLNAANIFTGEQTISGFLTVLSATGFVAAITANDTSATGVGGVIGSSGNGYGVSGDSGNTALAGVYGTGTTGVEGDGGNYGVYGNSANNIGVYGTGGYSGVYGGSTESGVYGAGGTYGVVGYGTSYGVYGSGGTFGVLGEANTTSSSGGGFSNSTTGDALFTYNQSAGYAAFFDGNVDVDGNLYKAGGAFKIDHPLDPENKYLYHSFVESPDMMNIYNGNVTTDAEGNAVVTLPEWFETLNRDFRYQLTVIGQFAQAIVSKKVENNQFQIRTSLPNVEVSWQVTGIRQDAWANANRIPVEEEKKAKLKGFYLHPELYGAPVEKSIAWARHPEMMKKLLQDQNQEKPAPLILSPILEKPGALIPPAASPHRVTK